MKRKALGKGLSALLPDPDGSPGPGDTAAEVPADRLDPNPLQPRTVIDPVRLGELAASIQESGMVQPILVRRAGGRYQIIAGERRWRAAQQLGLADRSRHHPRRARRPPARAGPGREHPARGAVAPRGGARLPAPAGGAEAHPGGGGAQGRARPLHGGQRPAPAAAAPRGPRPARLGRPRRRPRPRAPRPRARRGPVGAWRARPRARAGRCARWSGGSPCCARPAAGARSGRSPTRAPPRSGCAPRSGRGWRSCGGARAGQIRIRFASEAELNRIYETLVRPARGRG